MTEKPLVDTNIPWLEERTVLLTQTGSFAYGTNTEDSDRDYKGICVPPASYFLGLDSYNEYNNSGGKNFKNTKDDVDVSIIHINKFVRDAMLGVPNNIEILHVRPEDHIKMTKIGQALVSNRNVFLSKNIMKKFGGYATSQIHKMKVKRENGTGRQELIEQYDYDTKFFMHAVRLQTGAIEILETGSYSTYRPNREFLLGCRNGDYTFEEALEIIKDNELKMQQAFEKTDLPDKPNEKFINEMLMDLNFIALDPNEREEWFAPIQVEN